MEKQPFENVPPIKHGDVHVMIVLRGGKPKQVLFIAQLWVTSPDCNGETSHFSAAEGALIGFCARIAQILWLQRKNFPAAHGRIVYLHEKLIFLIN